MFEVFDNLQIFPHIRVGVHIIRGKWNIWQVSWKLKSGDFLLDTLLQHSEEFVSRVGQNTILETPRRSIPQLSYGVGQTLQIT